MEYNTNVPQPNQWKGNIRPVFYRPSSIPEFKREFIVDSPSDKYFGKVRFWIHRPTIEFPSVGIFTNFKNAGGTCLFRHTSISQIELIANALLQWTSEASSLIPTLETQAIIYREQRQKADELANQQRQIASLIQQQSQIANEEEPV